MSSLLVNKTPRNMKLPLLGRNGRDISARNIFTIPDISSKFSEYFVEMFEHFVYSKYFEISRRNISYIRRNTPYISQGPALPVNGGGHALMQSISTHKLLQL